MQPSLFDDVAAVLDEVSALEVMPRWRNLGQGDVAEKTGPDDLVTIADQRAEEALAQRLARLLPGSNVIGEEAISADPTVRRLFREPQPLWVIDPIDGTSAFAAGEPDFTIMVALVEEGRLAAGWILAPAEGWLVCGGPDLGARQRGGDGTMQSLPRPAMPDSIGSMIGLLGKRNITPERRAELEARARHFRALDGVTYAGIDYARLARGEAQFAVYNKTEPWDHLPGLAVVSGQGFHYARHDGSPYRPGDNTGGLLVTPGALSFRLIRDALMG